MPVNIKIKKKPFLNEAEGMRYEEAKRAADERIKNSDLESFAKSLGNEGNYTFEGTKDGFNLEQLNYINWNGEIIACADMINFANKSWKNLCEDTNLGIFTKVFAGKPIVWSICRNRENPGALTTACTNGKYMAFDVLFMNQICTKAAGAAKESKGNAFEFMKNYIQYVYLHECMHAFFYHFERELVKGCDNPTLANIAQDVEINGLIELNWPQFSGLTDTAIGGLFDRDMIGMKWEDIYDYYLQNMPDKVRDYMNKMPGGGGGQGGQNQQGQNSQGQNNQGQNGQGQNQQGDGNPNGGGGNSDFNDPMFQEGWMEAYDDYVNGRGRRTN